jgi:hypothetical protein
MLRDVRVPMENKLADAESFRDASRVLAATRGGAAWEALGHAMAAYEIALSYAKTRTQFGRPIASFQLVQAKLAEMLAEITGMQLYCFRMAQLQEQGRFTSPMASLAKMNHARKARQICLDPGAAGGPRHHRDLGDLLTATLPGPSRSCGDTTAAAVAPARAARGAGGEGRAAG